MRNKIIGLVFTFLSINISLIVYQTFYLGKEETKIILDSMVGLSFYSIPFVILGICISHWIDKIKITSVLFNVIVYVILGALISLLPIFIFNFISNMQLTIFVLITTIMGSVAYFLGQRFK